MKNALRNLITMTGLSAIALQGCADRSNYFIKEGEYNGFYVRVVSDDNQKKLIIFPSKEELESHKSNSGHIYAEDIEGDGRFDLLKLENVPKRDKLERFVDINELKKAYDYVDKLGEKSRK